MPREAYASVFASAPLHEALQIVVQQARAHYREMRRRVHTSSVTRTTRKPIFSRTQNRCRGRTRESLARARKSRSRRRGRATATRSSLSLRERERERERLKSSRNIVISVHEDQRATESTYGHFLLRTRRALISAASGSNRSSSRGVLLTTGSDGVTETRSKMS
jgi:hypothetical protein